MSFIHLGNYPKWTIEIKRNSTVQRERERALALASKLLQYVKRSRISLSKVVLLIK